MIYIRFILNYVAFCLIFLWFFIWFLWFFIWFFIFFLIISVCLLLKSKLYRFDFLWFFSKFIKVNLILSIQLWIWVEFVDRIIGFTDSNSNYWMILFDFCLIFVWFLLVIVAGQCPFALLIIYFPFYFPFCFSVFFLINTINTVIDSNSNW